MIEIVSTANFIFALFTLIGNLLIVLFLLTFILTFKNKKSNFLWHFLGKHGLILAFLISLTATTGSLFYSELAGFEPCKLCWFQRIFMYPQVFILGLSAWRKEKAIADYSLLLSSLGAILAGFHYYLQLGGNTILPCSAVGYSVSCSQNFVLQFGYITLPFMSLTAFLLIVLLMLATKLTHQSK